MGLVAPYCSNYLSLCSCGAGCRTLIVFNLWVMCCWCVVASLMYFWCVVTCTLCLLAASFWM